jgi:hypothetical protein
MHVSAWTGPYVSATRTGDGFAVEQRMPLARYFLCVGGVLLALLFIVDAYLPKFPVAAKATANSPVIRILSDRKWPERIVYDTSLPTIIPAQVAGTELGVHAPAMIAGASLGARERAAFAQLPSSDARELRLPIGVDTGLAADLYRSTKRPAFLPASFPGERARSVFRYNRAAPGAEAVVHP